MRFCHPHCTKIYTTRSKDGKNSSTDLSPNGEGKPPPHTHPIYSRACGAVILAPSALDLLPTHKSKSWIRPWRRVIQWSFRLLLLVITTAFWLRGQPNDVDGGKWAIKQLFMERNVGSASSHYSWRSEVRTCRLRVRSRRIGCFAQGRSTLVSRIHTPCCAPVYAYVPTNSALIWATTNYHLSVVLQLSIAANARGQPEPEQIPDSALAAAVTVWG